METNPRVDLALLCEDVREELNGKHTLVGVFSADIHVNGFPASIRFAMFFALRFTTPRGVNLKLRMSYTGKEPVLFASQLEPQREGVATLIVPLFLLEAPGPGDFRVEAQFDDADWQTLIQKHVSVGPVHVGATLPFTTPPS